MFLLLQLIIIYNKNPIEINSQVHGLCYMKEIVQMKYNLISLRLLRSFASCLVLLAFGHTITLAQTTDEIRPAILI